MGRKRIHPIKLSLSDRLDFSDDCWQNPELGIKPSSKNPDTSKPLEEAIEKLGVIYRIYCVETNRSYIGKTAAKVSADRLTTCQIPRTREHKKALTKGTHPRKVMQRDWDKHGEDSFKFSIVETHIGSASKTNRTQPFYEFDKFLHYRELKAMQLKGSIYNAEVMEARLLQTLREMEINDIPEFIELVSSGELSLLAASDRVATSSDLPLESLPSCCYLFSAIRDYEKHYGFTY